MQGVRPERVGLFQDCPSRSRKAGQGITLRYGCAGVFSAKYS